MFNSKLGRFSAKLKFVRDGLLEAIYCYLKEREIYIITLILNTEGAALLRFTSLSN